ncbi:T9SS type B sorting domain-containing protein [Pedobacter gandavensis]|uniref:T9SS type B sorting domain-containing protein n=1 Tax=Pedobacter gandavensis TaxID=2679963 RepID=A0ABR6F131_9SPHI|nr:gliding motility-associated C-terminal domain-containing protein [Pedobacter gandavensis]MBB2151224.1 T9SS type B sorting domain-containing protein [Pedobacter gandavensis]
MFNRKTGFVSGMLLLSATACFAQANGQATAVIPAGASLKLRAASVNAVSYQWLKDGVVIPDAVNIEYAAFLPGVYTVISYNTNGCASHISDPLLLTGGSVLTLSADVMITKSSENKSITVNDAFEYQLQVKNNGAGVANSVKVQDILPENMVLEQLLHPSIGFADYAAGTRTVLWQIPKLENGESAMLRIKVKPLKPGVLENTATVTANEVDPNLANNTSTNRKSVSDLFIPNVFTPNGDGKNDAFVITGLERYPENELSIFNRWGSAVMEKKPYKNDWDGSQLTEGTYFYLIKVKMANNTWEVYKGFITIIR